MLFKLNMSEAPADVVGLSGKLSREEPDTLFFDFELNDGYATAQIEDLCSGAYPTWIDPQKQKFAFVRQKNELWMYDLQTKSSSLIRAYLTVHSVKNE